MRTVAWVSGIGRLNGPELYAGAHTAERIGTSATNLFTVEGFETGGTYNPAEPNHAGSGAIGVIQFMPDTMCALLGLPRDPATKKYSDESKKLASATFARMTFIEQQEWVIKYFGWFKGKDLSALEDLYCAIFWPAAIGKPLDYVIGPRGSDVYRQNAGFDRTGNQDGIITKEEVCAAIRRYRATGDDKPLIEIPEPGDGGGFAREDENALRDLQERTSPDAVDNFARETAAQFTELELVPYHPAIENDDPPATERNS